MIYSVANFNKEYKRGLGNALIIYLLGIVLTLMTHIIIGWDYKHLPPGSSLIVVIFILIGIIKFIINLINIYREKNTLLNRGELTIHSIVLVIVLLLIVSISID